MIPKKLYVRELDIDIFNEEVEVTRAWVANRPNTGRRKYTDLSQVWHNISKKPNPKVWFIAQICENTFDTFVIKMDEYESWARWCKGMNVTRWAYVDDLLPKGGEE